MKKPFFYLLGALLLLPLSPLPGSEFSQAATLGTQVSGALSQASQDIQAYFKSLTWEQKKDFIWKGETNSIAGRSICAAEGNCNTDGSLTSIASGHVDPGNHVDNMGRYSYQIYLSGKTDMTIEEADRIQGQKLLAHTDTLIQRLSSSEVKPEQVSIRDFVSGLDVANQCPRCLTEPQGYAEYLKAAKDRGLSEAQAIEEARIKAYIDPKTGQYDAPGLRAYDDIGKEESIRQDVQRREAEIASAISAKLKELENSK